MQSCVTAPSFYHIKKTTGRFIAGPQQPRYRWAQFQCGFHADSSVINGSPRGRKEEQEFQQGLHKNQMSGISNTMGRLTKVRVSLFLKRNVTLFLFLFVYRQLHHCYSNNISCIYWEHPLHNSNSFSFKRLDLLKVRLWCIIYLEWNAHFNKCIPPSN